MKNARWFTCLAVARLHWMAASPFSAEAAPYVQGPIPGPHRFQLRWQLHFDCNCILPLTDPEREKIHAESVLGAAERYGFDQASRCPGIQGSATAATFNH